MFVEQPQGFNMGSMSDSHALLATRNNKTLDDF
jgi:hypothetical protein